MYRSGHDFVHHLLEPSDLLGAALLAEALADAVHRVGEAVLLHPRHQVINGRRLEGAAGAVGIRGYEDEERRIIFHEHRNTVKDAANRNHLVEDTQIWP